MQTFKIGSTNYENIKYILQNLNKYYDNEFVLQYCDYRYEYCDLIINNLNLPWDVLDQNDPDLYNKYIEPFNNEELKISYKTKICILSQEPHAFPIKDYWNECDNNLFHFILNKYYTISHFIDSPTNCFYPYFVYELPQLNLERYQKNKNGFCAIISSTESIHRKKLIELINNYKKVDIYGGIVNNRLNDEEIINILPYYKFTLAIENSRSIKNEYYITEKIINSYRWNTIPIYYGSDYVKEIFNEKTFINCNNLSNEEILNKIIEIDNDDQLYNEMLNTQPLLDLDIKNKFDKKLSDFIINILLNNI